MRAGDAVVREGDPGDAFYVIGAGAFTVSRGGAVVQTLGAGEAFGEIALLHDVTRTATVTAEVDGEVLRLERAAFDDLVVRYLGQDAELRLLAHLRIDAHRRLDEVAPGHGRPGDTQILAT